MSFTPKWDFNLKFWCFVLLRFWPFITKCKFISKHHFYPKILTINHKILRFFYPEIRLLSFLTSSTQIIDIFLKPSQNVIWITTNTFISKFLLWISNCWLMITNLEILSKNFDFISIFDFYPKTLTFFSKSLCFVSKFCHFHLKILTFWSQNFDVSS